jgi:phage-related protein
MLELLKSVGDLALGLVISLWSVLLSALTVVWDLASWIHVTSPRLEGLLVGVLLAWVLLRRDKHPLLRVLSSPLKLVVDVLDLAWAQCVEVVKDLWGTAWGWVSGVWNWCWGKVANTLNWIKGKLLSGYNLVMDLLGSIKNKLSKKEDG